MNLRELFLYKNFGSQGSGGGDGSGVTIKNQNKTVTENGTYKADSGYTGLGEVTVDVQTAGADVSDTALKYIRATSGGSFFDWDPYVYDPSDPPSLSLEELKHATLPSDIEKYAISLSTRGVNYTVRGRLGVYNQAQRIYIFPEVDIRDLFGDATNATINQTVALCDVNKAISNQEDPERGAYFDLSRITNGENGIVYVSLQQQSASMPCLVALPEYCELQPSSVILVGAASSYLKPNSTILHHGLLIGKYLGGMITDSIIPSLHDHGEKPVYVMEGYYGKSLYLSKISMSAETMVNIFNNLATITSGYTINIGSVNMAKLTAEQIAIATDKGWNIT